MVILVSNKRLASYGSAAIQPFLIVDCSIQPSFSVSSSGRPIFPSVSSSPSWKVNQIKSTIKISNKAPWSIKISLKGIQFGPKGFFC